MVAGLYHTVTVVKVLCHHTVVVVTAVVLEDLEVQVWSELLIIDK